MADIVRSQANKAKDKALLFLTKQTFEHIHNYKHREYVKLANENCHLRNIHPADFFMHDGVVYPDRTANGTPIRGRNVRAIPLHASLLDKFDTINDLLNDEVETTLKNLFAKILETSTNGLVLSKLLPTILLNDLKAHLTDAEFEFIDQGWAASKLETQSDIVVEGATKMIQVTYEDAFNKLRRVLMDRLLLDGV